MYEYGQYNQLIATNKDKLMNLATAKYHSQELTVIHKALNYAEKAHFKQKRKSGEPYLIHPIATAIKLIEWGMDFESVAAGLLHDVIEDTEYHYQDLLITFGQNIAVIVKTISKVTKYSKSKHNKINLEELKKSYVLQVFLSMSEDLRAIVVKLADRIHNIETIHNLNPNKQFAIAKETLTIYAVIAGRIGMYNIKQQLEDMCFKIIDPNSYWTIYKYIKKLEANIEDTWKRIQTQIKNMLEIEGIENQINYRLKGIYSIWKKMEKGYLPENIHDVFAMRIIVKNELQCYHVLGLIHLNFIYIMNAFKDFVSLPKWNLYRSIHTTIIANKFLVEFQIRTQEMHQISQMGLAAHWQYKKGNKYSQVSKKMVEQFLQGRKESTDTIKDLVKNELFNVYVLNDSRSYVATNTTTLLDLAYRFNLTKLTHLNSVFCNGEQVSFDTRLNRGDVVQFNYSHKVKIEDSWLTATKNINTLNYLTESLANKKKKLHLNTDNFLDKVKKFLKLPTIDEKNYKRRLSYLSYKTIAELISDAQRLSLKEDDLYSFFSPDELVWKTKSERFNSRT